MPTCKGNMFAVTHGLRLRVNELPAGCAHVQRELRGA